jgi:hypothetical protein
MLEDDQGFHQYSPEPFVVYRNPNLFLSSVITYATIQDRNFVPIN